jgi:putative two-component system response regulator
MQEIKKGRSRILVTDDEPEVRAILCELLSKSYECAAVGSAAEALARLSKERYDLVISDIMMKGMSGLEMVPHVKELAPEALIIMISGAQTIESAIESLRVGAFDYIMKPFDIRHVEAVVRHCAFRALEDNYRMTLKALAASLETRDAETHGHSERVVRFSLRLGQEMGLAQETMRSLEFGALLHDIGKIGVPDAILRKPGPLTEDEWSRMRQHPLLGQKILGGIEFLDGAARVVAQHHEKWDGSGYPTGLRGEEIDLNARIFAVADTFDAVVSNRVYRNGKSYEAALAELKAHAGQQFDPEVVRAFERVPPEEWKILHRHPPAKKETRSKPTFIIDELPHFVRNELAKLKMKEELHRTGLRHERAA